MKLTRKLLSLILAILILVSCTCVAGLSASAAGSGTLPTKYYSTNGGNKVGVQKTITIDGNASDWTEDMKIAQGGAWDIANHWKGGHENCVLDTTGLFAAWDSNNLYIAWQMVNTTDTWADREGDGSLSDGGRVLDVPLILALSVDPTSPKMSNKNDKGGPIWGQQMGLSFDSHVDRLFYMSGKPGLGEPSMFKAVDQSGNTNYTTGCVGFAKGGIEYKMAETNVCSEIWGLNGSNSPSDVYDENADWVDFKTYKGGKRTHKTTYDSFYEMKIPFQTLGISASDITSKGIGAMLVATRGESAIDCIPFDAEAMLDNAKGSYSKDASSSKEKEDDDVITVPLARIGKSSGGGSVTPATDPATEPPTEEPTTEAPTQAPTTEDPAQGGGDVPSDPIPGGVEMIYGDVDGSGQANIKDATAIQKHVALIEMIPENMLPAGDVDGNDSVNIKDATAIQKYLAKLDGAGRTGETFVVNN